MIMMTSDIEFDYKGLVQIVAGNLRDITWLAANMVPEDKAEINCQIPDEWENDGTTIGSALYADSLFSWVAMRRGKLLMAWGFVPRTVSIMDGWAFGTSDKAKAIPAINAYMTGPMALEFVEMGLTRIEVRVSKENALAIKWLQSLNCNHVCDIEGQGKHGEKFELRAWTRGDWLHVLRKSSQSRTSPTSTPRRRRRKVSG